jgi:hypothetical protein
MRNWRTVITEITQRLIAFENVAVASTLQTAICAKVGSICRRTKIANAGLKESQQALPNCMIRH